MTTNQNGILYGKTALIFGSGGAIGSAVAQTFAREGATLFLSGRHIDSVKKTAEQIKDSGYNATSDLVDAVNEVEVNAYFEKVFKQTGKIDIVFNAIGSRMDGAVHVVPSTETALETFTMYLNNMVLSQFLLYVFCRDLHVSFQLNQFDA